MHTNTIKNFVASKIQEHFWFLYQLNKHDTAYNIPSVFKISGTLRVDCLLKALNTLISKHRCLRANFKFQNNKLLQIIRDEEEVDFSTVVINSFDQEFIRQQISDEIHKPFDLEKDRLLRVRLFEIAPGEFYLSIVFHHIIIDLRSKELFFTELSELYRAFSENNVLINSDGGDYSEFCHLHNKWLLSHEYLEKLSKWANEYKNSHEVLNLPADLLESGIEQRTGNRKHFILEDSISGQLKIYCAKSGYSSFNVLLAAYFIFLHRISGQNTVVVGVPFTNRRNEQFQNTIGCFVNILPVKIDFSETLSFSEVIKKVRIELLKQHRRQEIPFLELNCLVGKPLFQAGFTFEPPVKLTLHNTEVSNVVFEREGAQLDVFLTFWETAGDFQAFFEYSKSKFSLEQVEQLIAIFQTTVAALFQKPEDAISSIQIIPEKDLEFIRGINFTEAPYEDRLCVHQKLEMQALKTPEAPAIIYNNKVLSYDHLNRLSNSFAHYLISKGVQVEDKIVLCTGRSIEMMIAIFGILKAGAAYVPVNINDPQERIDCIVDDALPKYILTSQNASHDLQFKNVIYIHNLLQTPFTENYNNPESGVTSGNLAYIIFTSGSTGCPKGVMIEHHSVMNRLGWMQKQYPLSEQDTLLQKTPISFDVSVWELFWWSFCGARLCILPPEEEKDPEAIIRVIRENAISTIHFVPSMFSFFLDALKRIEVSEVKSLKRIFLSGEALPVQMVNRFNQLVSGENAATLINLYGPTEATVDVSYFNCPQSDIKTVYIGRPIDNTKLWVVDGYNNLQPVGIPGELVITGVNLSRGYLKRPELNCSRFTYLNISGFGVTRAYKTGDLVKLCPNGELEYLGRMDNQVKIRGFRIELGEIESHILEFPDVENCAVIVNGEEERKHIVAYVSVKSEDFVAGALKSFLKKKLPEYMIPAHIIVQECLPLSSNGKIDRKALSKSIVSQVTEKEQSCSQIERKLSVLWKNLLEIEFVSLHSNFFDLGGNSLLAIRLCSEVNHSFKANLAPTDVFQHSCVKELAQLLVSKQSFQDTEPDLKDDLRVQKRKQFFSTRMLMKIGKPIKD